jgi:hypothetical protein
MKMVVAQGIYCYVVAAAIGGGLQMLLFSGAWLPAAVSVSLFLLVKGRITNYVYEQINKY